MKLTDIPPRMAADLLAGIVERSRAAEDRNPFRRLQSIVIFSTDEARVLWAGSKWLDKYGAWVEEATNAGGKVSVEETEPPLEVVARGLGERVSAMSDKEEKTMTVRMRDLPLLESAIRHLDHYGFVLESADKPKGGGKRR